MRFAAGDTNLYRYVFNSPQNGADPSGQIAFIPILVWMAGSAVVSYFGTQAAPGSNPYRYTGNMGVGRTSPADAVAGLGNLLARPALLMPTYWDGYGAELQHNLGVYATGLAVAFGVAEVVGGVVVGVGAGWTGVGLVAAGALICSGIDDIQAGVRQLAGDEDAVTSKFVLGREAAELAGADAETAGLWARAVDPGRRTGLSIKFCSSLL